MEMNVQIPFQQLLKLVQMLSPVQKARLRKVLDESPATAMRQQDEFIDFLLQGPVYGEKDIAVIEENRNSIAAWRTES
jgi:hypothetical protein